LKNGQKLKLRDAHASPPRNIQEVQASKLGDAPEAPLLHRQKSGHLSRHYIFIASCTMRFSWSVSCFCFQFSFALLAAINGLSHHVSFGGRHTSLFIFQEHSIFHSYRFNECSSFSAIAFGFRFRLDLRSDLLISFHQGVFLPLIFIGFHQKWCLKKFQMVLEKRKSFMQKKSGTRRSLCRLRPRLFHVMLDVFLIVCLVVLL
jgi:hypothetical protein